MIISDEYAAGFFDGEGSVYAANRRSATVTKRPTPTILVCITNVNHDVLKVMKDKWGGSINSRAAKPKCQAIHQWVMAARNAYPFLQAIAPHVIVKRDVVAVALQLCEMMRLPAKERMNYHTKINALGKRINYPVVKKEFGDGAWALHQEIRRLNVRGAPHNAMRLSDATNPKPHELGGWVNQAWRNDVRS